MIDARAHVGVQLFINYLIFISVFDWLFRLFSGDFLRVFQRRLNDGRGGIILMAVIFFVFGFRNHFLPGPYHFSDEYHRITIGVRPIYRINNYYKSLQEFAHAFGSK